MYPYPLHLVLPGSGFPCNASSRSKSTHIAYKIKERTKSATETLPRRRRGVLAG